MKKVRRCLIITIAGALLAAVALLAASITESLAIKIACCALGYIAMLAVIYFVFQIYKNTKKGVSTINLIKEEVDIDFEEILYAAVHARLNEEICKAIKDVKIDNVYAGRYKKMMFSLAEVKLNDERRYVLLTENKVDAEKLIKDHPELQHFKTDDRRLFLTEVKKFKKERDEANYIVNLIKTVHGYAK